MGKVIASVAKVKDGEVKAIAITHLIPFSGHGFTLYEGERLEGRDTHYTGLDLGAICGIEEMTQFIQIYAKQTAVKATPGKAKKKKEQ